MLERVIERLGASPPPDDDDETLHCALADLARAEQLRAHADELEAWARERLALLAGHRDPPAARHDEPTCWESLPEWLDSFSRDV
jgi:hypothetical protein